MQETVSCQPDAGDPDSVCSPELLWHQTQKEAGRPPLGQAPAEGSRPGGLLSTGPLGTGTELDTLQSEHPHPQPASPTGSQLIALSTVLRDSGAESLQSAMTPVSLSHPSRVSFKDPHTLAVWPSRWECRPVHPKVGGSIPDWSPCGRQPN